MNWSKGVTQKVISVTQLALVKEFDSVGDRTIWLREHGFKAFGRVTIRKVRHRVWFNPKLIDRRRVEAHFKMEMKNETQNR